MKQYKCPLCYTITNKKEGQETHICPKCDIIINLDNKCPDCDSPTFEFSRVEGDSTMGLYCYNSKKVISNQYMTREDFVELGGEKDCDKIRREDDLKEREIFKAMTSVCIDKDDLYKACKKILHAMNRNVECTEGECDSCEIVKSLIAKDIPPRNHGQIPTCMCLVEYYMEQEEQQRQIERA